MDNRNNMNGGNGGRNNPTNRYEREGVYYTPSSERGGGQSPRPGNARAAQDQGAYPHERPARNRTQGRSQRGRSQKSQLSIYYIAALLVSVIVCVVAISIFINSLAKSPNQTGAADDPTSPPAISEDEDEDDPNAVYTNMVALVISAAEGKGGVKIIDVEADKPHSVTATSSTKMSDKYDRPLVLEEFVAGSIVDISFDEATNSVRSMKMNASAWERWSVINVKIGTGTPTITIGNDVYTYSSNAIICSKGQPYDITRITAIDMLKIRGYKDNVWYVELVSGSGIVEIVNKAKIKNGTIEIGTNMLYALEDITEVELIAGHHTIVVKGDNIELFVTEIEVVEGERQTLDLSEVRMINGVLEITANVSDFTAYVDGKEVSLLAPIPLEYGEYSLRVTKDGYEPYESKVVINAEIVNTRVELKKIVNLGSLIITTIPNGASVYIDDIKKGDAPCTILLEYGTYAIRVSAPGYQDYVGYVDIFDKEHKYEITLHSLDDLWLD